MMMGSDFTTYTSCECSGQMKNKKIGPEMMKCKKKKTLTKNRAQHLDMRRSGNGSRACEDVFARKKQTLQHHRHRFVIGCISVVISSPASTSITALLLHSNLTMRISNLADRFRRHRSIFD